MSSFFLKKSFSVTHVVNLLMIMLLFSDKAWGALLGRRLAERGIIVACIDYRYSPFDGISIYLSRNFFYQ